MRNKPRIRFKGFTEDWEQRKLSDVLVERNEQQVETREYPLMSFVQGLGVAPKGERYDRSFLVLDQSKKYKRTELGDFIYSSNNLETGSIGINKTGKAVISPVYSIFQGVSIGDSQFIGIMSLLPRFIAKMIRFRQGVVYGQWRIHETDFLDISVSIPSVDERTKITQLILSIEEIITLHQRKLEKLKLAKKALLQKLFPKNGSKFPEIRFKGFTDAWEQRKFVDLLDQQTGIRRGPFGSSLKKDSFVKKSDYVVYEQQNAIYDNYETRYFISREKYNELIRFNIQPGDFIMSGAGTIGRISMVPDGIKKGIFNQALIRFKVNKDSVDPLYFLKFMQSDMMQKQLTQANPGSAMTNLVPMDELKKWDIVIPSFEEQNRISTFIKQIDDVITLHQRKLDRLQEVKIGLLQKMFV